MTSDFVLPGKSESHKGASFAYGTEGMAIVATKDD